MGKLIATGLLAAALAVGTFGCGDDDGGEGLSTGDVTRAEYVSQANAICADTNKKLDDAAEEAFGDLGPNQRPKPEQLTEYVNETVGPEVESELEQLRDLEVPEADADQIEAIYAAAQTALDDLSEHPLSLSSGEAEPFAEANKLARAYGLTACAGG
jgi:hypothetical protein